MSEPWRRYLEVSGRQDPDLYIDGLHSVAFVAKDHFTNGMTMEEKRMVAAHTLIMAVTFIDGEYPGSLEAVVERVQPHADNIAKLFAFEPEWRHMRHYIKGRFFNRGEDWIINEIGVIRGRNDLMRGLIAEGLLPNIPALFSDQKVAESTESEANKLKKLIVVRHGTDEGGKLTPLGIEYVQDLARELRDEIQGTGSITMHSSPVQRAVETAEIISEVIGKPFGIHPALDREAQVVPYSQKELRDYPDTFDLVQGLGAEFDTVILVTHAGSASCFPMYYRVHELGLAQEDFRIVHKGHAQVLDCETGVLRVI